MRKAEGILQFDSLDNVDTKKLKRLLEKAYGAHAFFLCTSCTATLPKQLSLLPPLFPRRQNSVVAFSSFGGVRSGGKLSDNWIGYVEGRLEHIFVTENYRAVGVVTKVIGTHEKAFVVRVVRGFSAVKSFSNQTSFPPRFPPRIPATSQTKLSTLTSLVWTQAARCVPPPHLPAQPTHRHQCLAQKLERTSSLSVCFATSSGQCGRLVEPYDCTPKMLLAREVTRTNQACACA